MTGRRMRRKYFVTLVVLGVLSFVLGIKDMATAVLMLTLGLAFPLLFAATAFVYLLCVLPMAWYWSEPSKRLAGGIAAIGLAAAIALLPGYLSKRDQKAIEEKLISLRIVPAERQTFRSLEVQKPAQFNPNLSGDVFKSAACDDVCRSLLENGEADWIRVVTPDRSNKKATNITLFVSGAGDDCKVPGSSSAAPALCVLVRPDHSLPASLIMKLEDGNGDGLVPGRTEQRKLYAGWRRMTAINDGSKVILRQQEQWFQAIVPPTIFVPAFAGMSSNGYEIQRKTVRLQPVDYLGAFRSLGFKAELAPPPVTDKKKRGWQREPTDAEIRDLISVLDLPGETPFNQAQDEIVNNWASYARIYKEWNPDRLALARRVFEDRRIGFVSFFDQVFTKPAVAKLLLPLALDEVEKGGLANPRENLKQALWHVDNLEPAILKDNAAPIMRIVSAGAYGEFGRTFLPAVSLIGENPLPFLSMLKGDDTSEIRIIALCVAEPKGFDAYVTQLRAEYGKSLKPGEWPNDSTRAALNALVMHGDDAFVKSVIDGSNWRNKGKMFSSMTRKRDIESPMIAKCR